MRVAAADRLIQAVAAAGNGDGAAAAVDNSSPSGGEARWSVILGIRQKLVGGCYQKCIFKIIIIFFFRQQSPLSIGFGSADVSKPKWGERNSSS